MRCKRRQRGFILLMAVTMIPLAGLAMLLATGQTRQLSRSLRAAEQRADAKTLRLSAEAWLRVHRETADALKPGEVLALPVGDAVTPPVNCTARRIVRDDGTTALTLTLDKQEINEYP